METKDVFAAIMMGTVGTLSFIINFCSTITRSVASGDRDELIRAALSLVVIYVGLVILGRATRMMWSVIKLAFKLAVISLMIFGIIYSYQVGLGSVIDSLTDWASSYSFGDAIGVAQAQSAKLGMNLAYQFMLSYNRVSEEVQRHLHK